jgi:predicted nucleic acid-binding Zn ribbon protein
MPLYVFRCPHCFDTVERLQRYTDPPPVCVSDHHTREFYVMERTFAPAAIATIDSPAIARYRSSEGFRITTTDSRKQKDRT